MNQKKSPILLIERSAFLILNQKVWILLTEFSKFYLKRFINSTKILDSHLKKLQK